MASCGPMAHVLHSRSEAPGGPTFEHQIRPMRPLPLSLVALSMWSACSVATPDATSPEQVTETARTSVDPASGPADGTLQGDSIVATMGDLHGQVVADMFAGDGYYAWKLLAAGARVLAIDTDPTALAALQARKKAEGIGDDRLLVRATAPGVSGLLPGEADVVLVTREYSTLEDRAAWFGQLLAGTKPPHTVFLVNYLPVQSPFGPPLDQRMDYNTISDELNEIGFSDVGVLYKRVPYRFILFASVVPEDAQE